MKYEKIYQKLREEYSDEEIVDSMLIPADLTDEEEQKLAEEMRIIRFQKLEETTEEDRIVANVMKLRFEIERYTKNDLFSRQKTFGKYVQKYLEVIKRDAKKLAENLSIEHTILTEILEEKREPSIELIFRLDKHSGNLIRTELWWKLIVKKQLFLMSKDDETRKIEEGKVTNYLRA